MTNHIQPNANVRSVMSLRGYRGYQLADALGMSRASMADRLSGKTDFRAAELIKLSHFLQVPATSFFENTGYGFEAAPADLPVLAQSTDKSLGAA